MMTFTHTNLSNTPLGEHLDWAHVYLLVWWTPTGERRSTSWLGEQLMVDFVVVGSQPGRLQPFAPPMWWATVPPGFQIFQMPERFKTVADKVDYAMLLGGVYASGWIMEDPVDRTPERQARGRLAR